VKRETYFVKREAQDGKKLHLALVCEIRDTLHEIQADMPVHYEQPLRLRGK